MRHLARRSASAARLRAARRAVAGARGSDSMSPMICYEDKKFGVERLAMIAKANQIIAIYAAQGYDLTLRQLYYQFVSRDLIANKTTEYKRLGSIINDARLAGLIDWSAIEDRTRNLASLSHWDNPSDIVTSAANSYRVDKWA